MQAICNHKHVGSQIKLNARKDVKAIDSFSGIHASISLNESCSYAYIYVKLVRDTHVNTSE